MAAFKTEVPCKKKLVKHCLKSTKSAKVKANEIKWQVRSILVMQILSFAYLENRSAMAVFLPRTPTMESSFAVTRKDCEAHCPR